MIGAAGLTGSVAAGSAAEDVSTEGSGAAGSEAGEPDAIGLVLLISIEGLESEGDGLIGSVSMASVALRGCATLRAFSRAVLKTQQTLTYFTVLPAIR